MTAQKGSLVLIKVGNGGGPETFSPIGGLRTSRMALGNQTIDGSNVSAPWRILLSAGIKSLSISGRGFFTDASSEETIRSYAFSSSVNNYQFIFANGDYITGPFQVTSYERSGDYDSQEMYGITLESAGTITFTGM
jgi:TP901-1 family phage major tail protein